MKKKIISLNVRPLDKFTNGNYNVRYLQSVGVGVSFSLWVFKILKYFRFQNWSAINHMIIQKNRFLTKCADAEVFLPLVAAFNAAEIILHTVYLKHCDQDSVFGGQYFRPCFSKNISFPEKFSSECTRSLRSSFSKKLVWFFGSVALFLCWIDRLCTYWGHRLPPKKQAENSLIVY